jgi:hypothetical protein
MKKIVITTIVSFYLVIVLFGQNKLPTTISKDTILTKANSPYLIASNTTVSPGATLKIEAGVTVKFGPQAILTISGSLIVQGTKNDSVYFVSSAQGIQWEYILNNYSNDIEIYYVKTSGNKRFLFGNGKNNVVISHCNIESLARGYGEDCIAVEGGKKVTIEYITLKGAGGKIANNIKNDAIDLDDIDSCFIGYNRVSNFSDDGVDIGTQTRYAYIHDNFLNNTNYGVTVGESSKAYLVNNVSYHNDGGFQAHTGAIIYCENNTLYANTVGVECFHSEEGTVKETGGTAIMRNTIFSQSTGVDIYSQTSSKVEITYSISDKDTLAGNDNFKADPMLIDPANGNFNLKDGSPCIKAGIDSSNNKVDIGGFPYIAVVPVIVKTNVYSKKMAYVYPNPADNYFNVLMNQQNYINCTASLYDITGKELLKKEINQKINTIDIHSVPSGIYFVKITSSGNDFGVIKLIKQ